MWAGTDTNFDRFFQEHYPRMVALGVSVAGNVVVDSERELTASDIAMQVRAMRARLAPVI